MMKKDMLWLFVMEVMKKKEKKEKKLKMKKKKKKKKEWKNLLIFIMKCMELKKKN